MDKKQKGRAFRIQVKTLEKPETITESTVQYYLETYPDLAYYDDIIKKVKEKRTKHEPIVLKEWEYIRWRVKNKRETFVFR